MTTKIKMTETDEKSKEKKTMAVLIYINETKNKIE
jgi:hypothetical protein